MKLLNKNEINKLNISLANPIDYRKSGLSLNHVIGCSLDCSYCVRHIFNNVDMKKPCLLMSSEEAVENLVEHKFFVPNLTPLQLFNRATDPFLPSVKEETFRVLELLSQKGLKNLLLLITRCKITEDDAKKLNQFLPLKVAVLVTYSGIQDEKIEPVSSDIAIESLETAYKSSRNYKVILYWRPLIGGVNDTLEHIEKASLLSNFAHATAFTGLFYRDEMKNYFEENKISIAYTHAERRKMLPQVQEHFVLKNFYSFGGVNLFRKTSCAVSFAFNLPDYNGHYGCREICDICPKGQAQLCESSWNTPAMDRVTHLLRSLSVSAKFLIKRRSIVFESLNEESRYFLQHNLGYQVHDAKHPHHKYMHGRANTGWDVQKQ